MQTLLLDRDDWKELVQAASRARACLEVLEKLRAQNFLTLVSPASTGDKETQQFVREFDMMLRSNRERLEEALLLYEDETPDVEEDA